MLNKTQINEIIDSRKLEYKRGWKNRLKDVWTYYKIMNLDLSGMSITSAHKICKKMDIDSMALNFRGFNGKLYHNVGNVYKSEKDYEDYGSLITTRNINEIIKEVEDQMKINNEIYITIGYESHNLEKSDENCVIKLYK